MTQRRAWTLGGLLALVTSGGIAGLELWPDPEPCVPMSIRVGDAGASCPDERHVTSEVWSDDYSTLHLECACK